MSTLNDKEKGRILLSLYEFEEILSIMGYYKDNHEYSCFNKATFNYLHSIRMSFPKIFKEIVVTKALKHFDLEEAIIRNKKIIPCYLLD